MAGAPLSSLLELFGSAKKSVPFTSSYRMHSVDYPFAYLINSLLAWTSKVFRHSLP
uniref:Uncharacterized protein n=1 Tax=Rhizophora mucronata TaxID=61149 RepID=A0A2P2Q6F7_RHIMU